MPRSRNKIVLAQPRKAERGIPHCRDIAILNLSAMRGERRIGFESKKEVQEWRDGRRRVALNESRPWWRWQASKRSIKRAIESGIAFEASAKAVAQRHAHLNVLSKGVSSGARTLVDTLRSCEKATPCRSPACPVCSREHRQSVIALAWKAFQSTPRLAIVTVAMPPTPGKTVVAGLDLNRLNGRIMRLLSKAGLSSRRVIGGIDLAWNGDAKSCELRAHLMFAKGRSETVFKKLTRSAKRLQASIEVVSGTAVETDDRARAFTEAFAMKGLARLLDPLPSLYDNVWLPDAKRRRVLRWLNKHRLDDFMFLNSLVLIGGRLMPSNSQREGME
jgi:hypothetical protein